jgi:hypothetical protein
MTSGLCMVGTRTPRIYHRRLSICPTVAQRLVPCSRINLCKVVNVCNQKVTACFTSATAANRLPDRSFLGVQRNGNQRTRDRVCKDAGKQTVSCSVATSHKSGLQCGVKWVPPLWTPQETAGWQAICNRRRRKASCHLLPTDTWNRFLIRRNKCISAMLGHVLN